MPEDIAALLRRALAGERAAVRALIDALAPVVQARVARILLRRRAPQRDIRQETEDLVQEVFVVLFADSARALRQWDPARGMSLPNFVGLVAEREVISILRSKRRNPWTEEPMLDEELDPKHDEQPSTERLFEDREAVAALLAAIHARLGDRGMLLFQWLVVEGRPVEEICAALGMTPDAVYAWKSRLAKLVREVAEDLASDPGLSPRIPSSKVKP
ncbi:RNA polymerase sigma factor [Polyangium sorediatum]|uniref:Sigma-70 family RNA polymerase sigma factor n=1 Tax=Polyangium sorediatum TaxID=889274 RepID=A0ABT6NVZ2_9BACT|nr:sigma-70 family RNA polymerase sigma factor [Polyangium sorediatum]MDI1432474.1 sigma-70 family RNA polymerase sigma factor [Polyangium sorediatum]